MSIRTTLARSGALGIAAALAALCVLLLAAAALAGIAQTVSKPTEDDLTQRGFIFLGENFADKFDELKGLETRIRVYQYQDALVGLYMLPDMTVYAFSRKDGRQPIHAFVDANNDDYCERTIEEGEDFEIDFASYKVDKSLLVGPGNPDVYQ